MVDDRLRRIAFRWGLIALIVEAYLASGVVIAAFTDLVHLVEKYGLGTITDRVSQLKPAAFKFPWVGLYIALFAVVGVLISGAMVYFGVRELSEDETPRPGE